MSETSVRSIKNEIRCRDDTVPNTADTRSHCKVWSRPCNNLPQPPPYISVFWGCGRLLHVPTIPCSGFLSLQFLARCHPYILFHMIFTLVILTLKCATQLQTFFTTPHCLINDRLWVYMEHSLINTLRAVLNYGDRCVYA